jgi:hypothetical protein
LTIATAIRTLRGQRIHGWHESKVLHTDRVYFPRFAKRAPARSLLAERLPLWTSVDRVFDQGGSGSCVTQAIVGAWIDRLRWLGVDVDALDAPSRQALYAACSLHMADGERSDMRDEGTYIPLALRLLRAHGAPTERKAPFSDLHVLRIPRGVDVLGGYALGGCEYERVAGAGDTKIEMIQDATINGLPVVFGVTLPRSFDLIGRTTARDPFMPPKGDTLTGGHAMRAVHVDPPTGHVLCVNSWSSSWGGARMPNDAWRGGLFWAHAKWVQDAFRDLHVFHGARPMRQLEAEHVSA